VINFLRCRAAESGFGPMVKNFFAPHPPPQTSADRLELCTLNREDCLSVAEWLGLVWRANLNGRQIMVVPRKTKTFATYLGPGRLSESPGPGRLYWLPHPHPSIPCRHCFSVSIVRVEYYVFIEMCLLTIPMLPLLHWTQMVTWRCLMDPVCCPHSVLVLFRILVLYCRYGTVPESQTFDSRLLIHEFTLLISLWRSA